MPHPYSSPSSQANQPPIWPFLTVESVEHVNDRESSFTPVADNNTRPCVTLSSRAGVDVLYRFDCELSAATHRPFADRDGGRALDIAMCCSGEFVETNHERSLLTTSFTVDDNQPMQMYFTKGVPTMGDHTHPMEGAILDFSITRMRLIELFERDGAICDEEQTALDLFDDAKRTVKHLHFIDQATETYKKQYHAGLTRYGKEKWELAGLKVEPIDPEAA